MNYRHIYCKIINNAKSQKRDKKLGYYEKHHILPKSLFPLWKNRKSNIVLLTAREHFFCHQLLSKIYPTEQMTYALHAFTSRPNADYRITSREYQKIKEKYAILMSKKFKGKKRPKSEIDKIVNTRMSRGYKHSEETKKKIGEKSKGRKWTQEQRQKRQNSISNREQTDKEIQRTYKLRAGYLEYLKNGGKEKQREILQRATEAAKIKNQKKVICVETGEVFDSITAASEVANSDGRKRNLSISIRRGTSCANGLHFKFLES